jgi:probable phosphoglycerate mutase
LLRHGATGKDNGRKYIGQTDLPLGEEGRRQAWRLQSALKPWHLHRAFSSDLQRSLHTAQIAIGDRALDVETRRDLREVAMGVWEGRFRAEIAADYPEDYAAHGRDPEHHRVEGGECLGECRARVIAAFDDIIGDSEGDILISAHGSTNRLLLCHLLGMPTANLFRLGQDHGCMNVIRLDDSGYRVTLLNHTP